MLPPADERRRIHALIGEILEGHWEEVRSGPVGSGLDAGAAEQRLDRYEFDAPLPLDAVIADCVELLAGGAVSMTHPGYFGLFNPATTFAGVVADTLVAAFNPQLAVESHAPGPVAVERRLLDFFARRLGLAGAGGTFTSGGAEANLTAVLVALERHFPEAGADGLASLDARPTVYASRESHQALMKIAHATGIGRSAVRLIDTDARLRMDVEALRAAIRADRDAGARPFLVVATAGTTAAGAIDPLGAIADVASEEQIDVHVDAAWAGAVCLSRRLASLLLGIERADSVTVDAHKWLSVPMSGGMVLVRDSAALGRAFRVATDYMPSAAERDPYLIGTQWSRRFIGLKLFMSLATIGADGYAQQVERDCALGERLRERLEADGWEALNDTPLPVVCFADRAEPSADPARVAELVERSGAAWISTVTINGRPALRACVTNYRSGESDVARLCAALGDAREAVLEAAP